MTLPIARDLRDLVRAGFHAAEAADLIEELAEALAPFVDLKHQYPESVKLISPALSGLAPVTVTVTKDQLRGATLAFHRARGEPS